MGTIVSPGTFVLAVVMAAAHECERRTGKGSSVRRHALYAHIEALTDWPPHDPQNWRPLADAKMRFSAAMRAAGVFDLPWPLPQDA